jgi:uncharacterized membrane protein YphA (DoxX/SURF4 family)
MILQSKANARLRPPDAASPPVGQDGHGQTSVHVVREAVPTRQSSRSFEEPALVRETLPASPQRPLGAAVRILFGLIWVANVYFKWQPSFLNGLVDVMHDGTMGQPAWLMPWFNFVHAVTVWQPTLWAYAVAIVETGIALALVLGFARKATYIGGATWSLLIWATAEGFGRMPSGVATDIGTAIVYAVVFLALLALDQCNGTRSYSLDAVIERRLPWWRRIAETRR